ncbi:Protein Ddg [Salmonella enterica subsp. enterica]|nr:Protein Ddg [Salmonella enterica subsp. enterica]
MTLLRYIIFVSTEGILCFLQSKFSRAFLHPRYWLTWFGVGILWLLVQLPYPVLRFLGTRTGKLARPFLKRRESIAQKNIELCFPTLSREEREKLIAENFHSLGMALLETGMAWFCLIAGFANGLMWTGWTTLPVRRRKIAA